MFQYQFTLQISPVTLFADSPEVGVAEAVTIFQTIAQCPVEGAVREEDDGCQLPVDTAQGEPVEGNKRRYKTVMEQVVGDRPHLWVDGIADHPDVGREQQQGKPPPDQFQTGEEEEAQKEDTQLFHFQRCFHNYAD